MNKPDTWNPGQYEKFQTERDAPAFDLMGEISPAAFERAIDLGCGTGKLTSLLHHRFGCRETVGMDNSPAMLRIAATLQTASLTFIRSNLESFCGEDEYDLIFSNAAIQWCTDHHTLLRRFFCALRPQGQLAIQIPANHDTVTHTVAQRVAREAPFQAALKGVERKTSVEFPESYAEQMYRLGFAEWRVLVRVYSHLLATREEVVEWVKGTLLTYYQSQLSPELFEEFLKRYREGLFEVLPDQRPFFYPFKRVFVWGRK